MCLDVYLLRTKRGWLERTCCERGKKDLTPFLSHPLRIVYQLPPDALSVRSFCHTDICEVRRRAAFTCTPNTC